jgi:hypothetical protein
MMDKEKQRELLKEIIQADEKDGLYDWDVTLNDGLKCDFCDYEGSDVEYCEDPFVSEVYPEENADSNYYCPRCLENRHDEI